MTATDKLRKYKSLYSSTSNTFSTGESVTITPASVVGLPTDTEITLTFDRVDSSGTKTPSKMERILGKITGANFVVSSGGRAVEGTEQSHTSPVVEMVFNAYDYNDLIDAHLVGFNQDGTLKNSTVLTTPVINTSFSGTAKASGSDITTGTSDIKIVTPKAITDAGLTVTPDSTTTFTNKDLTDTTNTFPIYCQNKVVSIQVVAGGDSVAIADGQAYITIPLECNGMNLVGVHARVITAGTTNTTDIQIRNVTDSVDMLSTKITIDSGETGSDTAATPAVIDTTKDDVATNDLLAIDVDAKSTTAPKGLIVTLRFALP